MNSEPVDPALFWREAAQECEFILRRSIEMERGPQDLTGELFDVHYLIS
jgi:hypothetical protein